MPAGPLPILIEHIQNVGIVASTAAQRIAAAIQPMSTITREATNATAAVAKFGNAINASSSEAETARRNLASLAKSYGDLGAGRFGGGPAGNDALAAEIYKRNRR